MVELLCLLRATSTWHFLLAICVIDVTFILLHISLPGPPPSGDDWYHPHHLQLQQQQHQQQQQRREEEKLEQVLQLQARVSRGIQENTRRLQDSLKAARLRTRALELIGRGVTDLERQISRLKEEVRDSGD
ncbi:uncharacterized protein LOC101859399 [Aplysia californica]|uniref:Uncharacterized protein LOC101859399 n=1 Tax=Aplysia californica TaxID=6500 RepID=A0ABM0JLP7_APLCA|nr:uncharacterized protein LOC101859399 [Aplysia californica]